MFIVGALLACVAIAGWRPLGSLLPSESVRAVALVSVALGALQLTGALG